MEKLIQLDKDLFLFLNNLGTTSWDGFWLIVTEKSTFVPLYLLLLFLIYRKMGWKVLVLLIFVIIAMITFTDQSTNLFKHVLFKRPRPCGTEDVKGLMRFVAEHCGRHGFFSGHSSNSMAAAVFAGLLFRPYYKYLIFILLFWSAMVAYSRIYVGVHFPLDIISGMVFGGIAGFGFYKLSEYLRRRFISSS